MSNNQPEGRHLTSVNTTTAIAELRDESEYARSGRIGRALVKSAGLRVLLQVLRAGSGIQEHHAPGPITVLGLEGELRFTALGETRSVRPGDLLSLPPREPHSVDAVQDSAFLLTIGPE